MKVKINDVKYNVELAGQGETLLLLHGFTGSLESWKPFLKAWVSSYQVVMLDILGHGKSDSPQDVLRYSIEQIADDLKELLETLNIKKIHVLGYSMGGRLALTFAVKYPQYVSSLILESSSPGLEIVQERNERIKKDEALANFILKEGIEVFVNYWENIPLFFTQQSLSADIRERIRHQRLNNNTIGLANSLCGMGSGKQPSWWNYLNRLNMPVYIMVGEKDKKFYQIANKMINQLRNAKTTVVKGTGHTIHVEQPDYFGKMITDFLKST